MPYLSSVVPFTGRRRGRSSSETLLKRSTPQAAEGVAVSTGGA
jgi:hypothetical protein